MIMNPNNGEILAMANKPDFNPNEPQKGFQEFTGATDGDKLQKMWRNRLVNDTFEPGSIFKVVTMIANMEEGLVKETDTFNCAGSKQVGGHTIKCWKTSGHGTQTLPEILQNSCNVGFMEIGARIGPIKLTEWIRKLGFGKPSGVDLPGEAKGIIKKAETITESDLATIAFGQTNTVNATQYMAAYNAIANGGTLIQPHVMKEISHFDESGNRVVDKSFVPEKKENLISKENAAILRDYLERTVNEGGSSKAYVEGYHIGAKTGTAQKVNPENGTYGAGKYISSMGAMAPVDNPQITIFISIDEPSNGAYYAGQIVAPIGKILMTDIFNYMETTFSKDDTQGIIKEVIIPQVRGLDMKTVKKILKENNLEFDIEGNGDVVTDIKPYPGYTVKEGSKIVLYTGTGGSYNKTIAMPDLRGYSLESVNKILTNLGVVYKVEGTGVVVEQNIPKGEFISSGTEVKLTLNAEYGD
ncbi:MAG: penicillin-binding transpeptidase domain-containing protein, partial [Clostridium sp.]